MLFWIPWVPGLQIILTAGRWDTASATRRLAVGKRLYLFRPIQEETRAMVACVPYQENRRRVILKKSAGDEG